jgi:ABC-type uncharacterized transport system ATPase subunit
MQTSATIEARDLTKTYKDVRALDGLGVAVEAGTVFGLLGPNGAGKSTTVKILTTLTRPGPRCCSWTSPPPGSTPRSGPTCGPRSPTCPGPRG